MKLVIASDHAGFNLKEEVRAYLTKAATRSSISVHSPAIRKMTIPTSPNVREAIKAGERRAGFYLRIRRGVSIAANKIPAFVLHVHDTYSAHQGVEHDDMNVIVLGRALLERLWHTIG